ncbi:MAG: hypothetical protein AB3N09_11685 [Tateyamaria sp.]
MIASRIGSLSVQPFAFGATDHVTPDVAEAQWCAVYILPALRVVCPTLDERLPAASTVDNRDPEDGGRLLDMAHQIGAQLYTTQCVENTGLWPNLAGFTAELQVIDQAMATNTALFEILRAAWQRRNDTFLGAHVFAAAKSPETGDVDVIESALARLMAVYLVQFGDPGWQQQLFDGSLQALPFAQMADCAGKMPNSLPPLVHADGDPDVVRRARTLGAMALLDMCYWRGRAGQDIETYFKEASADVDRGTVHIAQDRGGKPVGYATWNVPTSTQNVVLTRQSAPFGDHKHLLDDMRDRFETAGHATAHHPDSARPEQIAW